jgi:hypothetical protein
MLGESSRLSLTTCGLSTKAAFGGVSKGGVGIPVCDVVHSGAGPWAFVAVQPGGSAGGVTPSKLSLNVVVGSAQEGVPASRISVVASEFESLRPPAATSVFPIAAPPIHARGTFRLEPCCQPPPPGSYDMVVALGVAGVSPPKIQSLPEATALPAALVGLGMLAPAAQEFVTALKSQTRSITWPEASRPPAT